MLIVKKYGGSSVSSPEKILTIAKHLKKLREEGHKLIVIVSAMGDTTDDLVGLSRRITLTPIQREMDMLLSAGERISMALMSMALNNFGCDAISFTGSQSGVFTDGSHNNARIREIKAFRVKEEIEKGKVVIIAGFQGVNPETKEITTLGRGGSDTTAVAMAAHFKADRCDILTDVRGLYSIDPRVQQTRPRHFPKLDYEITMEMAYWGARVLHYRSVELAEREKVPLLVHLSSEEGSGTLIGDMEHTNCHAVNYNASVARLTFAGESELGPCLETLHAGLKAKHLSTPQILHERSGVKGREIFLLAPQENYDGIHRCLSDWAQKHGKHAPDMDTTFATVTVTGRGLVNSDTTFEMSRALTNAAVDVESIVTGNLSITFIIHQSQVQKAAQILHEKFVHAGA